MLRPLEEPLRTGHARRGGSGVDVAGGRLRRPGPARHACAVHTAWPGRRKRPYAIGGRSPKKPTPESGGGVDEEGGRLRRP